MNNAGLALQLYNVTKDSKKIQFLYFSNNKMYNELYANKIDTSKIQF